MIAKGMIVLIAAIACAVYPLYKRSAVTSKALIDVEKMAMAADTKDELLVAYKELTYVMKTCWHKYHNIRSRRIYELIQKKYNENLNK